MRKPELDNPPPINVAAGHSVTQVRQYRLITPLFGGGVTPGEADPVTVVRGSEIRGHLRFWWRATRGGGFNGSLKAMKAAEDHLWGAVSAGKDKKPRPSQVNIAIRNVQAGELDQPFVVSGGKVRTNKNSVVPAYAAFALQPTREDVQKGAKPGAVRIGVSYTLELTFPEDKREDVEAALWAWETFGGIGARTRRGFGALQCVGLKENDLEKPVSPPSPCNSQTVQRWLDDHLRQHVVSGRWPDHVPHLSPDMLRKVVPVKGDAIRAWRALIDALRRFRQSREKNQYGPTHWPEPNAIRNIIQSRTSSKSPFLGKKFPRAYFGLPIIFHFSHRGEPPDTALKGSEAERMASALVLRPLVCDEKNAVGLAAILEGPQLPPGGLVLEDNKAEHPVQADLSQREARQIKPLHGEPDVLRAFLDTLQEVNR